MKTKHKQYSNRWNVVVLLLVVFAFCVFLPRLPSFDDGILTLHDADYAYVGIAILCWLSTFFAAAFIYRFIALKSLPYGVTLLVQLASGFTNRLAPLGAGIITLNVRYLMKRRHSAVQAGAVVALNNLLGFVGIMLLVVAMTILTAGSLGDLMATNIKISGNWLVVIGICIVSVLIFLITIGRGIFIKIGDAFQLILQNAIRMPLRVVIALVAAMAITVGYTATLFATGLAFNVHISVAQALLVMTLGVAAASVTPTPGGVGGAEVGLGAALISVGVAPHQALTTALMYRFITYWLPILPGFICFQIALRRRYI